MEISISLLFLNTSVAEALDCLMLEIFPPLSNVSRALTAFLAPLLPSCLSPPLQYDLKRDTTPPDPISDVYPGDVLINNDEQEKNLDLHSHFVSTFFSSLPSPHLISPPILSSGVTFSLNTPKMTGKHLSADPAGTIYFGFGSNIWKEQVKTRCPTSSYLGIARLAGYRWFIAAQGGANIAKGSSGDEVWGLAYRLQPADEAELDITERVPTHFVKETIEAQLWMPADGRPADPAQTPKNVGVLVYISHERTAVGEPRAEYVVRMNRAIEDGLKEGIPSAYVDNVLRKYIPPGDV